MEQKCRWKTFQIENGEFSFAALDRRLFLYEKSISIYGEMVAWELPDSSRYAMINSRIIVLVLVEVVQHSSRTEFAYIWWKQVNMVNNMLCIVVSNGNFMYWKYSNCKKWTTKWRDGKSWECSENISFILLGFPIIFNAYVTSNIFTLFVSQLSYSTSIIWIIIRLTAIEAFTP